MTLARSIQETYGLSEAHAAIVQELTNYHAERFALFQSAQTDRARAPYLRDGKYSLNRLLFAAAEHNVSRNAPFELETSQGIAEVLQRQPEPGYYFVPYERAKLLRRDLTASVASAGGYLAGTETAPGNIFVGSLLAALGATRLGTPVLSMVGNASFPRVSGSVTAGWLTTEGAVISESNLSFAAASGTPKHVGGYVEVSGQLLRQTSPIAQNFVLSEVARAVASEAGKAIVNGSGASGQPLGILNTAGIGSVSGASLAYAGVLDTQHTVENANAVVNPGSLGWALPPTTAKLLRGRERAAGSGFLMEGREMAGAPVDVTNSMPASTALYGDWSSVALLEWGVLQVGADPYGANSALFAKNVVGIRALWSCDVVVLRAASFCKVPSIT